MISSMSSTMTSMLADTASVPLRPEASAPQASQPAQPAKPSSTPSAQGSAPQDTVALSATALDMSKALNEQADKRAELKKEAARKDARTADGEMQSYKAAGKIYPPFMGNSEELKALKQSSPALYREVLRMIVPPPLNLSPTELQALQGPAGYGTMSKSGPTVV